MITIDDARLAKEKLSLLFQSDNVISFGMGQEDGVPCVVVHLREAIPEHPYTFIDGVRIVYEVAP